MSGEAAAAAVLTSREEGIFWIRMNRPEAANSLNAELRAGLWRAFEEFGADDEARVAVLIGSGDKAFCAGGDLKEMKSHGLQVPPPDFMPHLNRNIRIDKPVIAAVNGVALGGGFLLAQMCDLCISVEHATFGITEARWGRGAPWANPLPWMIPPKVALEMMLTARPLTARRAYEVGLVNQIVGAGELESAARELAVTIAGNAPLTLRAAKQMVYGAAGDLYDRSFDQAEEYFRPAYESADAQEGPKAFMERRAPRWNGC